jgi:hypothetical protein
MAGVMTLTASVTLSTLCFSSFEDLVWVVALFMFVLGLPLRDIQSRLHLSCYLQKFLGAVSYLCVASFHFKNPRPKPRSAPFNGCRTLHVRRGGISLLKSL